MHPSITLKFLHESLAVQVEFFPKGYGQNQWNAMVCIPCRQSKTGYHGDSHQQENALHFYIHLRHQYHGYSIGNNFHIYTTSWWSSYLSFLLSNDLLLQQILFLYSLLQQFSNKISSSGYQTEYHSFAQPIGCLHHKEIIKLISITIW